MGNYYAALDLGTTGTRTMIFDQDGSIISSAYEEWESIFPSPVMVEQKAEIWWNALKKTIKESISKSKIDPKDIKSVAVTNQRETIVPVDADGNSLHNAIVWQDRRTIKECEFIENHIGKDKIYQTTGLTIDPYFSGSKILWIKNRKPKVYQNTEKFLLVHDYIVYKLTGKWITDYSNASRTMLFDINTLKWSDDLAGDMGLDLDKMPEAIPSGKQISKITTDETAFNKDTVVVSGGGDQQCAALGVGVSVPGRIKCTTGTGSFILGYLDQPNLDKKKRVLCSCHTVPGAWVQEASIFTSGSALRWVRDVICSTEVSNANKEGIDPYVVMDKLAENSPVGANGLIIVPHLVGAGAPHWNPNARGVIFGLALGHKRQDIIRGVLEGVSFEVRKNLEVFDELNTKVKEMRITGGGSRSNIWNQIMADILNIKCSRAQNEESTAVGAAILASYGVGDYKSIENAAENLSNITKSWIPNPDNIQKYNKIYDLSKEIYDLLSNAEIYKKATFI
ncbi:MAG: xylulokinase [Candidatus Lokiarchaeota archaeon]|nr:xylulokinase [Candidatus Lokiarchaeota archaeon]